MMMMRLSGGGGGDGGSSNGSGGWGQLDFPQQRQQQRPEATLTEADQSEASKGWILPIEAANQMLPKDSAARI